MNRFKLLAYAVLPAVALLALAECVALRVAFDDAHGQTTAVGWAFDAVDENLGRRRAARTIDRFGEGGFVATLERLYEPEGASLLGHFRERYRARFAELARSVSDADAKLVVLYVPPSHRNELARRIHAHDVAFYESLAQEYGAGFADSTAALESHDPGEVSYLPEDFHLTRFGNRLVAEVLAEALRPLSHHRSGVTQPAAQRPRLLGDLRPNLDELRNEGSRPYVLETNAQGLRSNRDLDWPRDRSRFRVLLLGDSYTFGLYMDQTDTYGAQLERLLENSEVLNAGALGYTIVQEATLFEERARFVEPDVVVLQVLFNDLVGLFAHEQRVYLPPRLGWLERRAARAKLVETEEERKFLESLDE